MDGICVKGMSQGNSSEESQGEVKHKVEAMQENPCALSLSILYLLCE